MNTITLRNLSPELRRALEELAHAKGSSHARTVIALLEDRLGLRRDPSLGNYSDLDALIGSWSSEEADDFDRTLSRQRAIDDELW